MKGGALICYIQIIAKIRKFDVSSSYKNDEGYTEFIQYIGEVLSSQPLYNQSFANLVYEVFESKKWKIHNLEEGTGYCRQTISNYLNNHYNRKEVVINICIALGLDLVMTMIFLISQGYILNIKNHNEKRLMQFLDTNHSDGLCRLDDYDDFIHQKK